MRYTTYATNKFDLGVVKDSSLDEVIIAPKDLSRFSRNSMEEFYELSREAKSLGLKVVLEWDVLASEDDFSTFTKAFNRIDKTLYDFVRVQDPGVLNYVLEESTKPIQLILEGGNHNLVGIKKWKEIVGARLERIVLSIELSKDKLEHYCKELSCPIEILVLGPVLLFYSPRKLLSPLLKDRATVEEEFLEAIGESEESPHKGFPVLENRHGSFMFHIKDLFLLDKLSEIESIGVDVVRVDLRSTDIKLLPKIIESQDDISRRDLKLAYGKDVIRGYYSVNKSDVLFKKLKNSRLQRKDENYIGEVLEARKSEYMAIHLKGLFDLKIGDQLKFVTPEGKEHFCKVHNLKDSGFKDQEIVSKNKLALINYMSGVWTKSQVYLEN